MCIYCHSPVQLRGSSFCSELCDLKFQELRLHFRSSYGRSMANSTKCVFCKSSIKTIFDFGLTCGCIYHEDCVLKCNNHCLNCKKILTTEDFFDLYQLYRKKYLKTMQICELCKNFVRNFEAKLILTCKCIFHVKCLFRLERCPSCTQPVSRYCL